jgi:hypothetical protein
MMWCGGWDRANADPAISPIGFGAGKVVTDRLAGGRWNLERGTAGELAFL